MKKKRLKFLLRWIALPLSVLLLALGAVTLPLPLPTGIILIGLGLAVAALNPLMLRFIKRTRSRYPRANARIRAITPRLPVFLRRILTRTDNHRDKPVS